MNHPDNIIDARVGTTDLEPLIIKGRATHPIVQGGMGVNISNGNLAGSVANTGAVGTLSSVGLGWIPKYKEGILHPLIARAKENPEIYDEIEVDMTFDRYRDMVLKRYESKKLPVPTEKNIVGSYRMYKLFHEATLRAAKIEIERAKEVSGGNGALWLNVMKAIHEYKMHVRLACETGLHGIVSGAGLPTDLPELVASVPNSSDIALVPILSNLRGVQIVMKKWDRYGRVPDAIVLEDPTRAAGHLGTGNLKSFTNPEEIGKSTIEIAVPEVVAFLKSKGLNGKVPVIAAGDIVTRNDVAWAMSLGAQGVQMGTRFLATEESGANTAFKQAIVDAKSTDDIRLYNSNAMLPARGLKSSGVFHRIEDSASHVRACVENCLVQCAYRDGVGQNAEGEVFAQMCILEELAMSTDNKFGSKGLMFCGISALRINSVERVRDVIRDLL